MKKNSFAFLLTLAMMVSMTGCGSQTKETVQAQESVQEQPPQTQEQMPKPQLEPKEEIDKKENREIGKVIAIENNTITIVLENKRPHFGNDGAKPQIGEEIEGEEQTIPPQISEGVENNNSELQMEEPKEGIFPSSQQKTITVKDTTVLKMETEDGQTQDAVISDMIEGDMIEMEYDEQNQLQTITIIRELQSLDAEVIGK